MKAEIIKHLFANLPDGVYDADEIDLKSNAVFPQTFVSGAMTGARVYHRPRLRRSSDVGLPPRKASLPARSRAAHRARHPPPEATGATGPRMGPPL